jgi:hypothetical protein
MSKDDMVLVSVATEQTGYNAQYIRRVARAGAIKAQQIGPVWLVSLSELQARKAAGIGAIAARTRKRNKTRTGPRASKS